MRQRCILCLGSSQTFETRFSSKNASHCIFVLQGSGRRNVFHQRRVRGLPPAWHHCKRGTDFGGSLDQDSERDAGRWVRICLCSIVLGSNMQVRLFFIFNCLYVCVCQSNAFAEIVQVAATCWLCRCLLALWLPCQACCWPSRPSCTGRSWRERVSACLG